jgi:hypothetical protein
MSLKELIDDVLPFIVDHAPTIGAAISGNKGVAAGYALALLADAFGVHQANPSVIPIFIKSNPNAEERLKNLEDNYKHCIAMLHDMDN